MNQKNDQLSATGKLVNEDINRILDTTKHIVTDKNENELLQKTYYHSHQAGSNKSYSERISELKQMMTGDVGATREDAKKNVSSFATIVKLALLSPEFRDSIDDTAKIINQLLKTREEKSSGRVSESTGRTQDRSVPVASQPQTVPVATDPYVAPVGGASVTTKTVQASKIEPAIGPDGATRAAVVETKPVTVVEAHPAPVHPGLVAAGGVQRAAVPTGTRAAPSMDMQQSAPVDKKARRERREEKLIDRLVDLAQTLHKNPEYRNSVMYLAQSSSQLKNFASKKKARVNEKAAQDKSKENTETVKAHKHQAKMNGKEFLENWIGDNYSLDPLINQIVYLQKQSKTDPDLRQLLADWKKWATSTIKDESYVNNKPRVREDVKGLISRTRVISRRYNDEVTIIRREAVFINKSVQRDDTVLKLRSDFQQLANDIVKDANGKPTLKPELLGDAQVIISSIVESIKYIPLPPIKRSDENMEVELENIVLNATDVTPSNVRFIVQADTDKNAAGTRQHENSFLIEISKIRAHLTSVNFFVDKKTGFPKITERGLADIDMGGKGLSLKIEVVPRMVKDGNNVHSVFHAKTVGCTIGKLKIHLRETSHDTLFKILSPIINKVAKKKIEVGICNYIQDTMNNLNGTASTKATQRATKADRKWEEKKQHS